MKIYVLAFILLYIFITGCEDGNTIIKPKKENNQPILNTELPNPYDSIGVMHNEIILYARSDFDHCNSHHFNSVLNINEEYFIEKLMLDTFLLSTEEFLLSIGYNYYEAQNKIKNIYNFFHLSNLDTTIQNNEYYKDIRYFVPQMISTMLSLGLMRQEEYNELSNIISAITFMNFTIADSLINELDITEYDPEDYPNIYKFKSIYLHSSSLWKNIFNINDKNVIKKDQLNVTEREFWVMFYDAIGSLSGDPFISAALSILAAILWDSLEQSQKCTCPICEYYGLEQ